MEGTRSRREASSPHGWGFLADQHETVCEIRAGKGITRNAVRCTVHISAVAANADDQLIAAWTDCEQQRVPSGTPNGQRAELRPAFFTGASSMAALWPEACNARLTDPQSRLVGDEPRRVKAEAPVPMRLDILRPAYRPELLPTNSAA